MAISIRSIRMRINEDQNEYQNEDQNEYQNEDQNEDTSNICLCNAFL